MLLASTSFRICSRNAFAFTDPLPRKKMARSTMNAKVMIDTTKLTYISAPPCSKNWASPCISCLLARAHAPQSTLGRCFGGNRRLDDFGAGPWGPSAADSKGECGQHLNGMADGVKLSGGSVSTWMITSETRGNFTLDWRSISWIARGSPLGRFRTTLPTERMRLLSGLSPRRDCGDRIAVQIAQLHRRQLAERAL